MESMANLPDKKIIALIQTKYESNILPGKSLITIRGKTVIQIISERLRASNMVSDIMIATTDKSADDSIIREAQRLGIKYFRGNDENTLKRIFDASSLLSPDVVVKVLGNYPLIDPQMMDELIAEHCRLGADYSYNEHVEGIVYGMGCEVIAMKAMKKIFEYSSAMKEEHLNTGTLFFRIHEDKYSIYKPVFSVRRPQYKVCIENRKDIKLVDEIMGKMESPSFSQVVSLLDASPILAESNRDAGVKEIGKEKIFLFPDKIKELTAVSGEYIDPTYPVTVELSLTNRCNLSCVWCSDRRLRERSGMKDLEFNNIVCLIDDLVNGGVKGIVIEGGGEPTLHPDFEKSVAYIKGKGISVGLITNGTRPVKKEVVNCFDWIRVSLDASTYSEFLRLKNGRRYEDIMKNILFFKNNCDVVGVGYVLTNMNKNFLESLVLRLREHEISYLHIRPVVDHPEYSEDSDLSYLKRYETEKFTINLDALKENNDRGNMGLPCRSHSITTVITADGDVYLCGRLNIYDWFKPIGNIKTSSFKNIWNGNKRKNQAAMLDSKFCGDNCPQCRLTKFNVLLDSVSKIKTKDFI